MPPPRLHDLVVESAARHGGRPALRDGERVVSHAALASAVDAASLALGGLGLRAGDRALVVAGNAVAPIVLMHAIARLGASAVLVTARLAPSEVDAIARQCAPRLALYVAEHAPDAAAHAARRGARDVELAPLGAVGVERLAGDDGPPAPADVAVMLCTSGTTGTPKLAMLTHANLVFLARAQAAARRYRPDDRVYLALPLAFAGAVASITLTTLAAGGCLHLHPRFEPDDLARAVRDDGITVVPGVPAMHAKVVDWGRAHPGAFDARAVRMVTSASSTLGAALKADVEALYGLPLQNGYGLTETTAVVCQTALDERRADTSVGRPLPGVRVRVADGGDADGEILVRGPNVFAGYFRDAPATAAAFTADGWFRTGDVGRVDDDGAWHLAARLKDVIKRSGYTVYPADVEAALAAHPDVATCAVVGQPHGADEAIVAFVQWRGPAPADARALASFLEARLAAHKRPGTLRFVDALPTTPSGKVDRAALRRQAAG